MKTFVIGDIHGAYKGLVQVLERANVSADDHLIFLGDYCDGWSQTPEVLHFLWNLQKTHRITFLKGNHDHLAWQFLTQQPMDTQKWLLHGGSATQKAYQTIDENTKQHHAEFINQMKLYYIDTENRLFIHAGFTHQRGVANELCSETFFWDRTLWELALAMPKNAHSSELFFPKRLQVYSEIFIGHTPTLRFGSEKPMNAHSVWNIDTGAAFGGSITLMDIHSKEIWQSDPIRILYPNEKGRIV